jgi:hypothetical protein
MQPKTLSEFFSALFQPYGKRQLNPQIQIWGQGSGLIAGVFDDFMIARQSLKTYIAGLHTGVFFTPNRIDGAHLLTINDNLNQLHRNPASTITDDLIRSRDYYIVDIDTVKPEGQMANETELQAAREVLTRWKNEIAGIFPDPIIIASGNGFHCLLKAEGTRFNSDDERRANKRLYKFVLEHWAAACNVPGASIDIAFTLRQGVRLPSSWNRKGEDTPQRPHRKVSIEEWPDELVPVTDKQMLDYAIENGYMPQKSDSEAEWELDVDEEDLEEFLTEYLCYDGTKTTEGSTTYFALTSCPLCGDHKSIGDGKGKCCIIFDPDHGTLGLSCFYCGGKLKDVMTQLRAEHDYVPSFWSRNSDYDDDEAWEQAMERWGLDWEDMQLQEPIMYAGKQVSERAEKELVDFKSLTATDLYDAFVAKAMAEDATYIRSFDQEEFRDRVQECIASEDVAAMAQYLGQAKVNDIWSHRIVSVEELRARVEDDPPPPVKPVSPFLARARELVTAKDWPGIVAHVGLNRCIDKFTQPEPGREFQGWVPEFREWLWVNYPVLTPTARKKSELDEFIPA